MRRSIVVLVLPLTLAILALIAVPAIAKADGEPPPGIVVVAVAGSADLDAPALRAAIARELGDAVVGPEDPLAAGASGRFDIALEPARRTLVVTYRRTDGETLTRALPAPPSRDETTRVVALLAGNLGRDEAAALAASLHGPRRPAGVEAAEDHRELEAADHLGQLLTSYASQDRTFRRTLGFGLLGGAVALGGVGIYAEQRGGDLAPAGWTLLPVATAVGVGAVFELAFPSQFEKMSSDYPTDRVDANEARAQREQAEARWKREADGARVRRIAGGIVAMVLGAGAGAIDGWIISQNAGRSEWTAVEIADGIEAAAVVGAGVLALTLETPIESRLHRYEQGLGHPIQLTDLGVGLAPGLGGAGQITLYGRF